MEDQYLYQQIADSIRSQISSGHLQQGDRLPAIREMTKEWKCTPGTVQRAYKELANQNLISSQPGKGTRVISTDVPRINPSLRKAQLIHRADAFLLEVFTAGFSAEEIEKAFKLSLDRWRSLQPVTKSDDEEKIRFAGSHDIALNWVTSKFLESNPESHIQLHFSGSVGGLIALAKKEAEIAGCHLWDQDKNRYNIDFIKRILPGKKLALIHFAQRTLGILLPNGNPLGIQSLHDLTDPKVKFINRQAGSGTRVWLDIQLQNQGIIPANINGYANEAATHSEVARAIIEGRCNAGICLETLAKTNDLAFIPLAEEQYDLVCSQKNLQNKTIQLLLENIKSTQTKELIHQLGGYKTKSIGEIQLIN